MPELLAGCSIYRWFKKVLVFRRVAILCLGASSSFLSLFEKGRLPNVCITNTGGLTLKAAELLRGGTFYMRRNACIILDLFS